MADTGSMAPDSLLQNMMNRTGLRQVDVADAMGVSQSAVSDWITGNARPKVERVPAIADLVDGDSIALLCDWWPEFAERDGLRELRVLLAGASPEQVARVVRIVRGALGDDAAGGGAEVG